MEDGSRDGHSRRRTPGVGTRRLREEEWREFRELRLAALEADPLAFGSTRAREAEYPDERWQDWARRGSTADREATFVAVEPAGRLVGMAGAFAKSGSPQLWGMWVRPTHRGQGIGAQLMDALLAWADRAFPGSPAFLEVNPEQTRAVVIYRARGFEFTGIEEPLGHHAPAVVRQMVRPAPTRS